MVGHTNGQYRSTCFSFLPTNYTTRAHNRAGKGECDRIGSWMDRSGQDSHYPGSRNFSQYTDLSGRHPAGFWVSDGHRIRIDTIEIRNKIRLITVSWTGKVHRAAHPGSIF